MAGRQVTALHHWVPFSPHTALGGLAYRLWGRSGRGRSALSFGPEHTSPEGRFRKSPERVNRAPPPPPKKMPMPSPPFIG